MSGAADLAAEEFLTSAYPDQRQRGHAERWLGLLACQADGAQVRWWQISALASAPAVLTARRIVLCAVTVVAVGWGMYGLWQSPSPQADGYIVILGPGLLLSLWLAACLRDPPIPRLPARAIRPHWPRGRREYGQLLVGVLLCGLGILPVLVWQWSVAAARLPRATPVRTYRAERLSCLVTGLACAPAGGLLGALAALRTDVLPVVVVVHAVVAAVWGALLSGSPYPLLKLSEVVMSAEWEDRVRFLPLLEDAADRGVLRRAPGGYVFRDAALQDLLIGSGRAALGSHAELRVRRLARKGVRAAFVKYLTPSGRIRVCVDFGVGVTAAAAVGYAISSARGRAAADWLPFFNSSAIAGWLAGLAWLDSRVRALFVKYLTRRGRICVHVAVGVTAAASFSYGLVFLRGGVPVDWRLFFLPISSAVAGATAGLVLVLPLFLLAGGSKMALTYLPRLSGKGRLGWAVAAAIAAGVLVGGEGTVLAEIVAFVLPAALVMACGTWACLLTFQRTRASRRLWLRAAPDVIAAATTGATLLVLVYHRLLTALPAAGLLFPAAAWGSFLLWRKMTRSGRLAVKAGADLVFALLLGGEVVLLLVWLANLLGMPRAEVVVLRAVLGRVGDLADLPWWAWAGAWLLLAAASLAFIRWPIRLKNAAERFQRWRVITVADITERALTGLHIALLSLVLVGMAAPPALTATVGRQLSAAYEVAFQRELLEEGELAAYTAISSQLAAQPQSQILTRLVTRLHDISLSEDRQKASVTESENARRLGQAEALALAVAAPPSLEPTVRAVTAAAGLTEPVPEPSDLAPRAAAVQQQETKDDVTARRVEAAADLATKVVASLISIPQLSDNEVVQVVREYLAGLIEDSSLKDRFAAWMQRLPGTKPPPAPETMVVPVPERLEQAAIAELSAEFTAAGDNDPVTNPLATDLALGRARVEDPLSGAVDIINQARYAQDHSGPCAGCIVPGNSDNNRPAEEPPPEVHVEEP